MVSVAVQKRQVKPSVAAGTSFRLFTVQKSSNFSDRITGTIWWVLARYRPTWSDVGSTLAPSVSGSLLGYTWYLVVAVLRDSFRCSAWQLVAVECCVWFAFVRPNKETTLLFTLNSLRNKKIIILILGTLVRRALNINIILSTGHRLQCILTAFLTVELARRFLFPSYTILYLLCR